MKKLILLTLLHFKLTNAADWAEKAIRAAEAKALAGQNKVIVAVIDTGIDLKNPLLKNHLWKNPGEIPGNGIDDDGNGLIDDYHGYNFASSNHNLTDEHGHGTHIAGIIQKVSPNVELMILKYYEPGAHLQNIQNTVKALEYAVKMGAHIINYSGGGSFANPAEKAALEMAARKNILLIAAAGNDGMNNDQKGFYPASYDLPNIVSVASLGFSQNLLSSSNYGAQSVDIGAPGFDIESLLPGNKKGVMTGTSQATAYVSGVAALALSQNPAIPFSSLKARLTNFVKPIVELNGQIKNAASLDAYRVLASRDSSVSAFDHLTEARKIYDSQFIFPSDDGDLQQIP